MTLFVVSDYCSTLGSQLSRLPAVRLLAVASHRQRSMIVIEVRIFS